MFQQQLVKAFQCILETFPEHLNLVLFVDGLDRLVTDDSTCLDWIPSRVAENVKIILTSRRGPLLSRLRRDVVDDSNNFIQVVLLDLVLSGDVCVLSRRQLETLHCSAAVTQFYRIGIAWRLPYANNY